MDQPTRRKEARGHPRAIPVRECFRVNLRDALCCRGCGRHPAARERFHRGFEYHHVTPVRDGGSGVAENVVLLCRKCHRLADAGRLAELPDLAVPASFACRACGEDLDPAGAAVSCGSYACRACATKVHLYDHFGYGDSEEGDRSG